MTQALIIFSEKQTILNAIDRNQPITVFLVIISLFSSYNVMKINYKGEVYGFRLFNRKYWDVKDLV